MESALHEILYTFGKHIVTFPLLHFHRKQQIADLPSTNNIIHINPGAILITHIMAALMANFYTYIGVFL